jgi:diguanylate cyclase (GGDEF)-like protein/PAS domain S-box-containing protein
MPNPLDPLATLQAALHCMRLRHDEVVCENQALGLKLARAEEALRAIGNDEVDALFIPGTHGRELFTRDGAQRSYRLLIEEMGEGALTLTHDGVVTYANRRFAAMLQRPLSRVIGSLIRDGLAPEGQAELARLLTDGRHGKQSAELDLLTDGGLRVPTLLTVNRLAVDGMPDALCMVATDLTGQRIGEAAIQARRTLLEVVEEQGRTEERLRVVLAALPAHVALLDARGVIVSVNETWKRFAQANGLQGDDFGVGSSYPKLCDLVSDEAEADDAARAASGIRAVLSGREDHASMEYPCHSPTEQRWFRMSVAPLQSCLSGGVVDGAIVMHVNISERKLAESSERAALAEKLLIAKAVEQSKEGLIVTDTQGNIVKVNQAFTEISGYPETDVLGNNARLLSSGRHDPAFFQALWSALDAQCHWAGEIWNRRKDGTPYLQLTSISRLDDEAGRPMNYIASFSDITESKAAEEQARRLAHFDPLTGLPNRTLLAERATQALRLVRRNGSSLALMYIDLDHFKNINDSLGHAVGDGVLVAVAARFQAALREQDTLSRAGGDEFVLLLPDTDAAGAAHVAQKLLLLATQSYRVGQHELTITPSIGIALCPADGADYSALAQSADAAMYRAKQGGRNGFAFHTADMQAQSARLLQLENALRRALERGELSLHYQPQLCRDGRRIVGAEALLRWQHPELGAVSPAEFIPIAESSGLITSIGEWVLRTATRQLRTWLDEGMEPLTLAVNLSAVQFRQPNLVETVTRILDEAGIAPERLELELTESVASDDPVAAVTVMNELHARGVRMSIDDFGTGYSSLSYLKRFKVYKLKIDRSFVGGVTESSEDQAIVTAIINLAGSLGMRTIAEGVETEAQARFLRERGCDEMQGYWFGRPLTAQQFAAFVGARRCMDPVACGPAADGRVGRSVRRKRRPIAAMNDSSSPTDPQGSTPA